MLRAAAVMKGRGSARCHRSPALSRDVRVTSKRPERQRFTASDAVVLEVIEVERGEATTFEVSWRRRGRLDAERGGRRV